MQNEFHLYKGINWKVTFKTKTCCNLSPRAIRRFLHFCFPIKQILNQCTPNCSCLPPEDYDNTLNTCLTRIFPFRYLSQGRIHVWSESAPAPLLTDKSCKFSLFYVIFGLFSGYINHPPPPLWISPHPFFLKNILDLPLHLYCWLTLYFTSAGSTISVTSRQKRCCVGCVIVVAVLVLFLGLGAAYFSGASEKFQGKWTVITTKRCMVRSFKSNGKGNKKYTVLGSKYQYKQQTLPT